MEISILPHVGLLVVGMSCQLHFASWSVTHLFMYYIIIYGHSMVFDLQYWIAFEPFVFEMSVFILSNMVKQFRSFFLGQNENFDGNLCSFCRVL